MNIRLTKLRQKMLEKKLDAFLVSNDTNRRYLSGFTGSAGFLYITQNEAILSTDSRYIEQAASQADNFRIYRISDDFASWLPGLIVESGSRQIGFESNDLSLATYRQLVKGIRRIPARIRPSLISFQGMIESLRAFKEAGEIEIIKKAAKLADDAEKHAANFVKPGITEKQLAWELERFLKDYGSESLPFEIIVASGPNAALPHAQPSDRVIINGDPVVIDLGARINGYTSDITRTICCGVKDEKFLKIYDVVLRAQLTALEGIRVQMTGDTADRLARDIISQSGYGEAFGHGLGHGVGLETHEMPRLGSGSNEVLLEGMVFTVEPGIYLPGWGGTRIEDRVLLEPTGPRILTHADK